MRKLACFRGIPIIFATDENPDPSSGPIRFEMLEPGLNDPSTRSSMTWDNVRSLASAPAMQRFRERQRLKEALVDRVGGTLRESALERREEQARIDPECTLHDMVQGYGEYHPRIWRPGARVALYEEQGIWGAPREEYRRDHESYFSAYHVDPLQASHVASLHLYQLLGDLVRVLEPDRGNATAFGHSLRQLLILACTEVEAGWRGILQENRYPGSRWSTVDYVKLGAPMRLAEWAVRLAAYPKWGDISPFNGWTSAASTSSLPWYDAYNKVKHDREGSLHLASMDNVIMAMAALTIVNWAQFGERVVGIESVPHTVVFAATARPTWGVEEWYVGPNLDSDSRWHPVSLSL